MKSFDEKAVIQRVCFLRNQYAGSRGKSKFAGDLGISPSTYNYYENNRLPPIEILLRICDITGADLIWLLTGQQDDKKFAFASKKDLLSGPNSALLRKLDEILTQNPELSVPISAFVELLCEKKEFETKSRLSDETPPAIATAGPAPERGGWIPVLGRTAAGMVHFWGETSLPDSRQAVTQVDSLVKKYLGKKIVGSVDKTVSVDLQRSAVIDRLKGSEANLIQVRGGGEDEIVEFIDCKQILDLFADSFALQIDGDSMSPRINDADIVILSPSVPAGQGQIAVARLANQIGVTCKLFRTTDDMVHLIPINENYETKIVPKEELLWSLAVLCHITV